MPASSLADTRARKKDIHRLLLTHGECVCTYITEINAALIYNPDLFMRCNVSNCVQNIFLSRYVNIMWMMFFSSSTIKDMDYRCAYTPVWTPILIRTLTDTLVFQANPNLLC